MTSAPLAHRTERGIALIAVLLMTLLLSAVGSSLILVGQTETLSSLSYKTMSQARYAAESGVHAGANYLLYTYVPPQAQADLDLYDMSGSPVRLAATGAPVVLSSDPGVPSTYPDAAVRAAFTAASLGTLNVGIGSVQYRASAELKSMRQIDDAYSGQKITMQTWEITGVGSTPGAGSAAVEVSAVVGRQVVPAYRYAAFSTNSGCASLSFAGGAETDSYDSRVMLGADGKPVLAPEEGNVGSNGNLEQTGEPTVINGTLSTPRAGVGACTQNNVTAASLGVEDSIQGLVELPQPVVFPTPEAPDPAPPMTNDSFADGTILEPPAPGEPRVLGNLTINGNDTITFRGGIPAARYIVNSITMAGNGSIEIVPGTGPVIIEVAGQNQATPINLTGGSISNPTYDPTQLQFVYGGTGEVKMRGGAEGAALVYAPNAMTSLSGGADFYGAIVTGRLTATGGAAIHYDRALQNSNLRTAGNFTMHQFTWKTF